MESKLTKLLAPLERDEQSLMKLDAIFAVRIFLSFGLSPRPLKLCSEDLRFTLSIVLCFFSMSASQTIGYTSTFLWNYIANHLKDRNAFNFSKQLKFYLLSEQHSENLYSFDFSIQFYHVHIFSLSSSVF